MKEAAERGAYAGQRSAPAVCRGGPMNKYQTLATNTVLMSIGTFGSKLLVFLMVRFYTGYLTPAEYGTADLITQTANLLIPLVSLDITDGVFRFAADRRGGRADAFSVGLRTVTAGSLALLLAVLLLQGVVPSVRAYGLLLASFVAASCYHALCAHFVRAKGNTALFAAQGLFNTALFIGLNVLFLAVFHWGIRGYVLSTTVANLITAGMLVWRAQLWRDVRLTSKRSLRQQMLRYCVPLIPTAVFWWIMGVSDRYMVKYFMGSDANGIYAVAYKIPTILTILATVFMDAWQLSAIAESSGDRKAHLRFYGRVWDTFASAVLLGAGGIIALSPVLIRVLAEEAYYSAWRYIPMLTLSMAAAAFSNFMGSVYVVTKKSTASFWTSLVGAVTNVVLNLLLIPRIGIQGAAAATFVSCLAVFLIRLVNARRLLPFPLSGGRLAAGVAALLVQTAFLLMGWRGWLAVQVAALLVLLALGLPALLSTLHVILHRKQA